VLFALVKVAEGDQLLVEVVEAEGAANASKVVLSHVARVKPEGLGFRI
jgi:hypothetical protein